MLTRERKVISLGVSGMHLALAVELLRKHKIRPEFYHYYDKINTPWLSIFHKTISA